MLRAGDMLVVRWVDRLGRNYADVTEVIRQFMARGVIIRTVINGLTFDGATKDPMQKAVRDALIAFMAATAEAQAERPQGRRRRPALRTPGPPNRTVIEDGSRASTGRSSTSSAICSRTTPDRRQKNSRPHREPLGLFNRSRSKKRLAFRSKRSVCVCVAVRESCGVIGGDRVAVQRGLVGLRRAKLPERPVPERGKPSVGRRASGRPARDRRTGKARRPGRRPGPSKVQIF